MSKFLLVSTVLFLLSSSAFASSNAINHHSPKGKSQLISSVTHTHMSSLFSYVNIKKDSEGQQYLELHHSNGTTSGVTIPYVLDVYDNNGTLVTCYLGKQFLGSSRYGSVKRSEFFKVPAGYNVKVGFGRVNEDYNLINIGLKAIAAVYGSYYF